MFKRLRKVHGFGRHSIFYNGGSSFVGSKFRLIFVGIAMLLGLSLGFYSSFVCNDSVCEIQNENHLHIIIKRQPIDIENLEGFSMHSGYLYAVMKDGTPIKIIAQKFSDENTLRNAAIRLNDGVKLRKEGKNVNVFIH